MKALLVNLDKVWTIELISENQQEREDLIKAWDGHGESISCEEWRELYQEGKERAK